MPESSLPDPIYNLHHSLDPITIEVSAKVFKLNCFAEVKKRFAWDFVNDIGIVNLLRHEYLRTGELSVPFKLYQSTRLDQSHRYESLFATLVITIVGSVISGIVLEHYKDFKERLSKWISQRNDYQHSRNSSNRTDDVLLYVLEHRKQIDHLDKFCTERAELLLTDLKTLTKCFIARKMLNEQIIGEEEYHVLVDRFFNNNSGVAPDLLIRSFTNYETQYLRSEIAIQPEKVMATIDAYARGILLRHLDDAGMRIDVPQQSKNSVYYKGLSVASGAAQGFAFVYNKRRRNPPPNMILVIDSNDWTPDLVDLVQESGAVVTTHCGMTGHVPLVCRGIGKACVVLSPENYSNIDDGDMIAVGGHQGIVIIGFGDT